MYGAEKEGMRHRRGMTIMLTAPPGTPNDIRRLDFPASVDDAQQLGGRERIPTVYAVIDTPTQTLLSN
jgi:hypothetical protein